MFEIFPYERIREQQKELMSSIWKAIIENKHILINAPTGIGKTVASLVPAIEYYLKNNDTKILFLTSRHTQHNIVIETINSINNKNNLSIRFADLLGKRWMCLQPNVEKLTSYEFNEFCKTLREQGKCSFYSKTRKNNRLTTEAKHVINQLLKISANFKTIKEYSKDYNLCPYEIAMSLAKESTIIIADYHYIFNPSIRMTFVNKLDLNLSNTIIIVDEAHNLPNRLREILSKRLTSNIIRRAIKQVKKRKLSYIIPLLVKIQDALNILSAKIKEEKLVKKESFMELISKDKEEYLKIIDNLEEASDKIRETEKISYLSSIASFLDYWLNDDDGFIRFIRINNNNVELIFKSLDPSFITSELIQEVKTLVLMSGTLNPLEMYQDLLGFNENNSITKSFSNPFPKKNRLNLIIPKTTSLFKERNEEQYKKIASICEEITNTIEGNVAIFFPSYQFLKEVNKYFNPDKPKLIEQQNITKEEKNKLLETFKTLYKEGSILLGVTGASFSEGIDLPGEYLKAVIIVGLPLEKPSLETKALIEYYEKRFNKGWLYGYIYPAMTKVIQAAGRCIRTENDKGIIIFLEERYAWPMYKKIFPEDWHIEIKANSYINRIKDFLKSP